MLTGTASRIETHLHAKRNVVRKKYIRIKTVNQYHGWSSYNHRGPDWESSHKPHGCSTVDSVMPTKTCLTFRISVLAYTSSVLQQNALFLFTLTCLVYMDALIIPDGS